MMENEESLGFGLLVWQKKQSEEVILGFRIFSFFFPFFLFFFYILKLKQLIN